MYPEPNRFTPYFLPHSTDVSALTTILSGDDRYYNNIFIGFGATETKNARAKAGLKIYDNAKLPVWIEDNVYLSGAKPSLKDKRPLADSLFNPRIKTEERDGNLFILFTFNDSVPGHIVQIIGTEQLGKAKIPKARFDNPDGSLMNINRDFSGNIRTADNNITGPFVNIRSGQMTIKVW
jgi:hypothetical protein